MSFDTLGLAPRLVARLTALGLTEPTPIQEKAIPHALAGRDVLGLAQTGTGKTAAFGLPLIQALTREGKHAAPGTVGALILAPTRELARQIEVSLAAWTGGPGALRMGLVTGGRGIGGQARMLERGVDVLVATPGRLIDLLDRRDVRLGETRFLVLDEADQMLDLGFIHALRRIAALLPRERQTMLFSATMPAAMAELARAYLTDPVRVEAAPPGKPAERVAQSVRFVAQGEKPALLADLLDAHRDERALVFARTKHGAERLMKTLDAQGFAAASIHGNKSQGQRDRALEAFRKGGVRVLVATDVAARGLDIPGVGHVYNYELPNVPESYVHRIGRTARAGADGQAVAFCSADEMGELRDIERLLGTSIPVAGGTAWPASAAAAPAKGRGRGKGQGQGRGQGAPGGGRGEAAAKPSGGPRRRRPARGRGAAARQAA
jgi:ATP-dependent RNA helicase RhlE